ncbi:MAG: cbb3-type cytochrome oxidase assembly protein CcoS [Bermanella sp.]|nr:cbb3-type cytochrome oxidase assembly protein CcoS [Bermanella sp.]|tara:strand:+ start:94 stop:288 length:195 start_codon:yes stop_codon:yes gene_type:complete
MDIIFITVPVTILFIATAVAIFFWANKGGQYDDLDSPAHRILFDDDVQTSENESKTDEDQEPPK